MEQSGRPESLISCRMQKCILSIRLPSLKVWLEFLGGLPYDYDYDYDYETGVPDQGGEMGIDALKPWPRTLRPDPGAWMPGLRIQRFCPVAWRSGPGA